MNKHTPGPWERLTFSNHEIQTDFAMVKIGGRVHMVGHSQEDCANALLIASAPDLLEAAQLALQIAESWIHDQLDGTSSIDGALLHLDPVRAAIARARGEA